jgi:diguanylate cyclase (GGDEF)-like protein
MPPSRLPSPDTGTEAHPGWRSRWHAVLSWPRRRRRARVATLLLLVLLIPLTALAALTGSSAVTRWSDREAADEIQGDSTALSALMACRIAMLDEYVPSAALAQAADFGLDAKKINDMFGIDYAAAVRQVRPRTDRASALRVYPPLKADYAQLVQLRPSIDAGHAKFSAVVGLFNRFVADVDTIWQARFDHLRRAVGTSSGALGLLSQQVEATSDTFAVLTAAQRVSTQTELVVKGPGTPRSVKALIEARSTFAAYSAGFPGRLGPHAAAAWRTWQHDPAALEWEKVVAQTVDYALAGRRSPLAGSILAYGSAFSKEPRWLNELTAVIGGASTDMKEVARREELAATGSYQFDAFVFALSVLFVASATLLMTRAVVRPLRRLAASARRVAEGDFTLRTIPPTGPREVADTILAVDDMTAVLAAVESFTVTLAKDPTAPSLDVPLPGRTGLALQTTLDLLRESVLASERQRVVLNEVATHDSLTGVLNRKAAFDAVSRELSRACREHTSVMVLFIDLDGLKSINDNYGHRTGDDAIRLTAKALRDAVRASDVVARLGGDEFLVAGGAARSHAEIQALAERAHAAVTGCSLQADGQVIPLRCSIGIGLSEPGDDVEALVHRADQALYGAKTGGRDRICWQPAAPSLAALGG